MKKPWLAAILNLLFFGGGYIYNGRRTGIGCGLVLAWILIRAGEIPIYLSNLVFDKWLIMFAGIVVLQICFAIDGYKEAKAMAAKA
jgi:hypothetical protein